MGNAQAVKSAVKETLITDENLEAALKRAKGSEAQMVSWIIKDFNSKGDSYTHVVTSVEVDYLLNEEKSAISFIAKLGLPQPTKILSDSINFAFVKEARIYQEFVPLLNTELTSLGLKPLRVPKCYYATWRSEKEVLYLHDLRSLGFQIHDRKKPFDIAHTTLVLKELARLHAASLLLQVTDGYEDLDIKFSILNRDCFDTTKDTIKMSKTILNKHIEKVLVILKELDDYKKAVKWLENLRPRAFELMIKQLDYRTRFAVVCHGDCWNNNMLFRYDAIGNPAEVMLINLELFRRASLAIDLKMLFYHSLSFPDREANLQYYLDTYYASFRNIMEAGGLAMPFTRDELVDEFESKHLYACFWAMACLPTLLSEEEEEEANSNTAAEVHSNTCNEPPEGDTVQESSEESILNKKEKDKYLCLFRQNPEMKSRFLSLFDGIIQD